MLQLLPETKESPLHIKQTSVHTCQMVSSESMKAFSMQIPCLKNV